MLHAIRNRMKDEKGFTLIELLVVILIIGILAAIAIPSFISQKDKANDAAAKSYVRNMQTAEETYFTDNNAYADTLAKLQTIEPALNETPSSTSPTVTNATANGFTVTATSKGASAVAYSITKDPTTSQISRSCTPAGKGGCSSGSTW
jgi:type IV pilus assembly protein PilA